MHFDISHLVRFHDSICQLLAVFAQLSDLLLQLLYLRLVRIELLLKTHHLSIRRAYLRPFDLHFVVNIRVHRRLDLNALVRRGDEQTRTQILQRMWEGKLVKQLARIFSLLLRLAIFRQTSEHSDLKRVRKILKSEVDYVSAPARAIYNCLLRAVNHLLVDKEQKEVDVFVGLLHNIGLLDCECQRGEPLQNDIVQLRKLRDYFFDLLQRLPCWQL